MGFKHGLTHTLAHKTWMGMVRRCYDPRAQGFDSYGAKGITVCDRWRNDAAAFIADMGPRPTLKHQIDRIDNNKGYSPENCRWVTCKDNQRNRRSNHRITIGNETKTLIEWAETVGLSHWAVRKRIQAGWSPERALFTPINEKCSRAGLASSVSRAKALESSR